MENKVLQRNLEIISKYDKTLVDKILMFKIEKANFQLAQSQNGEYNVIYKNIMLHNEISPTQEAKNIVSKLKDRNNSIRIIYGLGLGYLADIVAQEMPKATIIIYEPEIEILFFVLQLAQIDALYKHNVILCNDKKTLQKHVNNNSNDATEVSITFLNSYKKMYEKDIHDVLKIAQKEQAQYKANINTLIKKAPNAIINTIMNLKMISKTTPVADFIDIYKGKTALIVSAGPSLKENIEIIKQNKDKFVIFAISAILKLLHKEGIKPDFIVDIETQNENFQYKDEDISQSYLILEAFSNHLKYKLQPRGIINYISNNNFINKWIIEKLGLYEDLETCGTVSHTALYSAFLMGFDKIIVIGQDLAYKDGKCYADGSWFDELECVFDDNLNKYVIRAKDIEKYAQRFWSIDIPERAQRAQEYIDNFLNANLYTIKSQDGKYLPTQSGYAFFAEWFAKTAIKLKEEKPNLELINSSIGGAQIDGFENIPLSEAVKNLEKVEKLELTLRNCDNYQIFSEDLKEIKKEIEEYKEMTQQANILVDKIIADLKIKKVVTSNNLKTINKHNELLSKIIAQSNKKLWKTITAQFAFQLLPLIENPDIENLSSHIKMYENIKGIYAKIIGYLNRLLPCLTNC